MLHLCWNANPKATETLGRGLRELFPVEPVPPDFLALLQALDAKLKQDQPAAEATPAKTLLTVVK
jgi:hypothetical protein